MDETSSGRVYDPELGRFMSADPFVQAPYNSQSYNRYSYVFNNPLSFTDPSGYLTSDYCPGNNTAVCKKDKKKDEDEVEKVDVTGNKGEQTRLQNQEKGNNISRDQQNRDYIRETLLGGKDFGVVELDGNKYLVSVTDPGTVTAGVGGAGDYSKNTLMGDISDRFGFKFFKHYQGGKLAKWIDAQNALGLKVRVISHSWGADTAMGVIAKKHTVDTLITVDPVGWFRPNLANVKSNTRMWINYDSDYPGISFRGGNFWSWIGGSYNDAPKGYADFHYDITTQPHADICSYLCRQQAGKY
ncbi:RHS repeat-associated core domain-containing protein [Cellvibrio sp. OA-2007]|uniref:RHS repeat-associated core domain-containing protein n=1 Tax=Cellvibrio sp. OA-2007 TaxID=529823 RepID=UPI000780FE2D|nr:RHS repeat-associated core domain-containing protein [Cellvibrio sp. OA-2007]